LTSPAAIAANRRNACASTGPKTAAGKARASRNAVRHGLNVRRADPTALGELAALARRIAGDWARDDMAFCHALRIAMAQRVIQRVRLERARRVGIVERHCAAQSPVLDAEQSVRDVAALDRYERRAFSQRKAALRAFARVCAGSPPPRAALVNLRAAVLAKRSRLRRRPNVWRVSRCRPRWRVFSIRCGKTARERAKEREPTDSRSDRARCWGDLSENQRKVAEYDLALAAQNWFDRMQAAEEESEGTQADEAPPADEESQAPLLLPEPYSKEERAVLTEIRRRSKREPERKEEIWVEVWTRVDRELRRARDIRDEIMARKQRERERLANPKDKILRLSQKWKHEFASIAETYPAGPLRRALERRKAEKWVAWFRSL
jgi:hypothetical protein